MQNHFADERHERQQKSNFASPRRELFNGTPVTGVLASFQRAFLPEQAQAGEGISSRVTGGGSLHNNDDNGLKHQHQQSSCLAHTSAALRASQRIRARGS